MKKVILFGASGNLGKEIAKELKNQQYDLTVVIRTANPPKELTSITSKYIISDVSKSVTLKNICNGFDVVISALGKSVSPNDKSKASFRDIDLIANSNILEEALKSKIQKFVYVSAFNSEKYLHLEYFKVHHDFSEKLKNSGINYSIIKPPAIFSAFLDVIQMAKNGQLMNIGSGDKKTNPIYEGDLAVICVRSIHERNTVIEAGGKHIYTRKQLNEIVQRTVAPQKKIRTIPLTLVKMILPLIKITNKNMYHKFSFFTEVMQHDTIAPQVGEMKFEDYVHLKHK